MIFQLEKITVREFYGLDDEELVGRYMKLEEIMKPNGKMFGKHRGTEIGELTFGEVVSLKNYLSEPNYKNLFECFKIVYGVNERQYLDADIVSYFYAMKWIKAGIISIVENQKKVLTPTEPDFYLEMAGAERLNVFGEFATLLILGRSFGLDPEVIEGWKYNKVFSILAYDKIHGEVQKRYHQLKSKAK